MRHFFQGLVVMAITMLVSAVAMAGNQETAEMIAKGLNESGKLGTAKIGVKFQDGTAWLHGQVQNDEQMAGLLKVAFSTPGVTRVVNNMSVGSEEPAAAAKWMGRPAAPQVENQTVMTLQAAIGAMEPDRFARPNSERLSAPRLAQSNRPAMQAPMAVDPQVRTVAALEPAFPEPPRSMEVVEQAAPQPMPQVVRQAPQAQRPSGRPIPIAYRQPIESMGQPGPMPAGVGAPQPMYGAPVAAGPAPQRYDEPCLPNYAWPSYAAYPNYAALTYPKQYSPTAWPYIGPFYPYPQVPLGWRKVTMEWDDGWWWLDFKNVPSRHRAPVGRHY